jgi:ElaA protein
MQKDGSRSFNKLENHLTPDIRWECKPFQRLSLTELYRILQLRTMVFIVEQNCPYLDEDDKDKDSLHLMAWNDNQIIAYTRLLPPGIAFDEASIGRVVTHSQFRKHGLGRELMNRSIEILFSEMGTQPIRIGAQLYLRKFYESLGFYACSDVYVEDGIDHIEMLLLPNALV